MNEISSFDSIRLENSNLADASPVFESVIMVFF